MRSTPKLAIGFLVVLTMVAFAGCTGSGSPASASTAGAPPSAAAPAGFSENTGAVDGTVVDDEGVPVPGADVALAQKDPSASRQTVSDVQGKFTFSEVPPGTYNLLSQKLGYQSFAKSIQVEANGVVRATATLVILAVHEAYADVWSKAGYFDCNWQIYPPALIGGTSGPCGTFPVVGNVTQISGQFDNNHRAFEYPAKPGLMTAFNELRWSQGSAATGDKLAVSFSYAKRTGYHWYCKSSDKSPVHMQWQRADDNLDQSKGTCVTGSSQFGTDGNEMPTISFEKGLQLRSFVSTGSAKNPATGADFDTFALAYQQHFDVWFSMFYNERAPETYTALKDA